VTFRRLPLVAGLALGVALVGPVAEAKRDGQVAPGHAKKAPAPAKAPAAGAPVSSHGASGQPAPAQQPSKPPNGSGPKKDRPTTPDLPPTAQPPTAAAPASTATAAPVTASAPSPTPASQPTSTSGRRQAAGQKPRPQTPARAGRAATRAASVAGGDSSTGRLLAPATPRGDGSERPERAREKPSDGGESVVTRTVRDIVEIVPGWMKVALAALALASLLLAGGYLATALRARSLAHQRGELLNEVGLLQSALLPPIPDKLGALHTSVAYRPADGPAAGGDFYDALPLDGGRVGFIIGDVSGHGRDALERTAFMRYTLRAYLEAGLEPRVALQVAERAIGDHLGGDFATVLLAVHDPATASLRYATAGHPAPIVVEGHEPFRPVIAGSSPPIGVAERTGLRQTNLPLMPGTVVCLFTDGLVEARTEDGLLGADRLEQLVAELGPRATARQLIDRVRDEACATPDDMAACLISPTAGVTTGCFRSELLEISDQEAEGPLPRRFLEECGVPAPELDAAEAEIRETAEVYGGAIVSVAYGARRAVRILPRNVATIESASWRAAAAVG
jgi:hypothetical protein